MPTSRSISMARLRAARRDTWWWTIAASAIWAPTVSTGSSDVTASWPLSAIRLPRRARSPRGPGVRVDGQRVTGRVERHHGEVDCEPRKRGRPPGARHLVPSTGDHVPPAGRGRGHAEPEEREPGFEQHHIADAEGRGHDDRTGRVGQHVAKDHAARPRARRPRRDDEVALAQAQYFRSHQAAGAEP